MLSRIDSSCIPDSRTWRQRSEYGQAANTVLGTGRDFAYTLLLHGRFGYCIRNAFLLYSIQLLLKIVVSYYGNTVYSDLPLLPTPDDIICSITNTSTSTIEGDS